MVTYTPNYFPLMRINCPEWYARKDFQFWLNSRGTATWHYQGTEVGEYSDAFFIWCGGDGSDSPSPSDRNNPGIPEDIWESICENIGKAYGESAKVFVWLLNLDQEEDAARSPEALHTTTTRGASSPL